MFKRSLVLAAFLAQAGAAAAAPNLSSGLWEISTTVDGAGTQTMQQCFDQSEVAKYSQGMPQSGGLGGGCQPKVQDSGNSANWTLACAGPPAISGSGQVSYSGNSFDATSRISVDMQGQKMDIGQKVSGRRIGDCKK